MSNTTPNPDHLDRAVKAAEIVAKAMTVIASAASMAAHAYAYERGWRPSDIKSHEEAVQGGVQQ